MSSLNAPVRPRVVILGGGFGGLNAALALRRTPVDVTLIDRRNHHLFQPLLYQVATAGLSPADIAEPIRRVVRGQRNVTVLLAEVTAIDVKARSITLDRGSLEYDYLIVACGASHSWFGHDEWAKYAMGLARSSAATSAAACATGAVALRSIAARWCTHARDRKFSGPALRWRATKARAEAGSRGRGRAGRGSARDEAERSR